MQRLPFGSFTRLSVVACLICLAFPEAVAAAGESEEIEFARGVVKAKLETERTGSEIDWINLETSKTGRLRIIETQILDRGLPCRWYQWSVETGPDAKIETAGRGCRVEGGEWLLEETVVVRETVEVRVPVEVVRPAPEPKDPMAEVTFTRPETMSGVEPVKRPGPDSGESQRGTWQED